MNKLAICISGSLRSIEYCLNNFIENIILPNQKEMKIVIFYYIPNDINATKIDVLKTTLEDICESFYLIKDDISLPVPNVIWKGRPTNQNIDKVSTAGINGYLQQLYGIQQSYLMMENFEKKNNTTFDYVLRVRHDVIFNNPVLLNKFIKDAIIVPDFHYWTGINDRFAFGKKNLMKHYMLMYTNLYKLSNNTLTINNAEHFAKINLCVNNVSYKHEKSIKFNRIRMDGIISKDSF